ncbi:polyamine aminopropyltransferase [Paenibacillus oenotherae]|uniref:Polyamine aminopropyltransferase n=1 Tax=Paenibacillus oenotherae TaxID=1435645 RepID=A0ABS7D8C4_9BACL|nr:polyamine aminopropyltransferase [Paenibacillus oenotherae]MBW7476038.1 polyamine aminopropyltransferase [Paenibacillus oenotherae]
MADDDLLLGYEKDENELWLWDDLPELHMEVGYRINRLLHFERSAYQEISVAETSAFGRMLVLDGVPQITEKDGYIYNEMISHIGLLTHPNPQYVAMIGGGDCGPAREAARYPDIKRIDVVEIDPRVTDVCQRLFNRSRAAALDPRITIFHEDGARWIQKQRERIDVLLIDRSDPFGPAAVLYSRAFYQHVYSSLSYDGIAVFQSGSPFFDMKGLKTTYHRLQSLFPIVRTYVTSIPSFPGGIWSFTVASKRHDPLAANTDKLPAGTRYMNKAIARSAFALPEYIQDALRT